MPAINGSMQGSENVTWEYHSVVLHRVPGYGFGIAVSGGRDNPHFANGDPAIAISDVLKSGPGENKLLVNDRILSANGINLENVDYATAVQVLRDNSVVQLVIKRRLITQNNALNEFESLQITLNRNGTSVNSNSASKRYSLEDYGLQIATQLIVTNKYRNLQVGDVITSINNTSIENKSFKEVKKLIEKSNFTKLDLGIQRKKCAPATNTNTNTNNTNLPNTYNANQNLYVQQPRRAPSLYTSSHEGLENLINGHSNLERFNDFIPPPTRTPLANDDVLQLASVDSSNMLQNEPNGNYNYLTNKTSENNGNGNGNGNSRLISFYKKGSVGIRLAGGNVVGIFVTAIQPNSPASLHLQPGDRILSVNNTDLINYTREEAVSLLMSLSNKIDLNVISKLHEYNNIIENNIGDSFYIRTHFAYSNNNIVPSTSTSNELSFKIGDIFHVVDTLYNGTIGYWEVLNISNNEKGIIMNKKLAEIHYRNLNKTTTTEKTLFFLRRKNKKSNFDAQLYQCYERVTYKHPNFRRPIILFGPISDIARERLSRDYYHEFIIPALSSTQKSTKISQIREIIENGKQGLLDVNPSCTDKLNYAGLYPIIILLKIDNKLLIKNIRANIKMSSNSTSERNRLSEMSKKMTTKNSIESNIKFEKNWSHILTATLHITNSDTWFKELKELIDSEQKKHIWISDEVNRPTNEVLEQCEINRNSGDYAFPMHRHSIIASPPSPNTAEDFNRNTNTIQSNEMQTNDQSINLPNYTEPPPYTISLNNTLYIEESDEIPNHKEIEKEVYNSPGRLHNKLNYMPILTHSPAMLLENGISKPPKIDRSKKPKSATERLFGGNAATFERNANTNSTLLKSMLYDDQSNLEDHEEYYNNNHNVYRFTRSTVQPPNNNNIESKPYGKGYLMNSMEGRGELVKNEDIIPESNYNPYMKTEDLSNAGLPYNKLHTHLTNGQSNYVGSNEIYNTKYLGERTSEETNGGKYIYKDSNDNPYKPIQPIQKMRIGLKPIPPPKPVKPIRTDLYGTASGSTSCSNSNNSFYLNVPISLGNREQSAFELYRKEQR